MDAATDAQTILRRQQLERRVDESALDRLETQIKQANMSSCL
jgi:hypothetical protein